MYDDRDPDADMDAEAGQVAGLMHATGINDDDEDMDEVEAAEGSQYGGEGEGWTIFDLRSLTSNSSRGTMLLLYRSNSHLAGDRAKDYMNSTTCYGTAFNGQIRQDGMVIENQPSKTSAYVIEQGVRGIGRVPSRKAVIS